MPARHTSVSRRRPRAYARIMLLLALVAVALAPTTARAADPPEGATWWETYITTPDGERLHTDVLRPEGLTEEDRTPVILIVSPYLGMTGLTSQPGPSDRFYDLLEGADVFDRGYSIVMVSLRGTGGSSGCLDILGPGEQTDVLTAVEWSRTRPWSTGRVGMYGKSYDANTGVVGAALGPEGLDAVVAQQISPDRYRTSYNDRVRLAQSVLYPAIYGLNGDGGFSVNNDNEYVVNSTSHSADCQVTMAEHYLEDESMHFWRVRDFVERAEKSRVPTLLTTGYLDNATNIGVGAVDLFNALDGPKRLWIGWWDHVRGNDTVGGGRLAMGREGWFDEVMRFYDHYLKDVPLEDAPTHLDPVIAAQGSDGIWRSEEEWPPADAETITGELLPGTYEDDGRNIGSADSGYGPGGLFTFQSLTGHGSWTFSPPLGHRAHLGGIPVARIDVTPAAPRTNLVVNVYDVSPDGAATMITRGAAMVDAAGTKEIRLWPTDWRFEPGHRVGVLVSGANQESYVHVSTRTTVTVDGGEIDLPFLRLERTSDLEGDIAPRLETYLQRAPFDVAPGTIEERTNDAFPLPDPQEPPEG